jgi:hypothetical protein
MSPSYFLAIDIAHFCSNITPVTLLHTSYIHHVCPGTVTLVHKPRSVLSFCPRKEFGLLLQNSITYQECWACLTTFIFFS